MMIILRCMWTSFDYISGSENIKKFDDYVVGGVYFCRMFAYPEAPRASTRWTMRKITSVNDALRVIHYPDPTSTVQVDPIPITL